MSWNTFVIILREGVLAIVLPAAGLSEACFADDPCSQHLGRIAPNINLRHTPTSFLNNIVTHCHAVDLGAAGRQGARHRPKALAVYCNGHCWGLWFQQLQHTPGSGDLSRLCGAYVFEIFSAI